MTAIEFENISKQYRLGLVSTRTLSHDLNRWWQTSVLRREDPYLKIGDTNDRATRGDSEYVWALRDINFKVEQGDVVGIIGKNGAGKSTLLKLLSKVTTPTTGTIRARGRIASLLEVGTGFHGEMTGRENIYLNGAIMGMTKQEIDRKLDEIVNFSGCERYIDTPVKRYSSGMTVRLGFAVAAHLDPEILVVDEVLAVGDAEFQKKAIGKMQDISHGEGRTVLFVSHNMMSMRKLCRRGVVLKNGMIDYVGNIYDSIDYYINDNEEEKKTYTLVTNEMHDRTRILDVKFVSFELLNSDAVYSSIDNIYISIKIFAEKHVEQCRINIGICDMDDNPIGSYSSSDFFTIEKGEYKILEYSLKNPQLAPGEYSLAFSVGTGNAQDGETNYDVIHKALTFEIDKMAKDKYFAKWDKSWGVLVLNASLEKCISDTE